MLKINENKMNLLNQTLKIGRFTKNGIKGYDININLIFENNNQKGYLNLSAGFENYNIITSFINKEYRGIPFDGNTNNEINFFEIFDTEKFFDTEIENEIKLTIENIVDNKIKVMIVLNDNLINISFNGFLDIVK